MDVVWVLLAMAVCAGLFYLSYRIEPHWVSKDGQRFMCTVQVLGKHDVPASRIREARGRLNDDATIRLDQKQTMRRSSSMWHVVGRAPVQPKGKAVFIIREAPATSAGSDGDSTRSPHEAGRRFALRLPVKSSLIAELDRRAGR